MLDALGLFDTLVPLASITTVFCIVAFLVPRNEYLGLFFLTWWITAVIISLQNVQSHQEQLTVRPWVSGDAWSLGVMLLVPILFVTVLCIWSKRNLSVKYILCHAFPPWALVALHVYRLDGCSLVLSSTSAYRSTWLAFQMLVLDVSIGASSLPMAWVLYRKYTSKVSIEKAATARRKRSAPLSTTVFLAWNALGLYDIVSAYIILICNFLGVGGASITNPPLTAVTIHPLPLLLLFQVPLALVVHVRFLYVYGGGILFGANEEKSILPL